MQVPNEAAGCHMEPPQKLSSATEPLHRPPGTQPGTAGGDDSTLPASSSKHPGCNSNSSLNDNFSNQCNERARQPVARLRTSHRSSPFPTKASTHLVGNIPPPTMHTGPCQLGDPQVALPAATEPYSAALQIPRICMLLLGAQLAGTQIRWIPPKYRLMAFLLHQWVQQVSADALFSSRRPI